MAERLAQVLEKLADEGKLQSTITALESASTRKEPQPAGLSSQRFKSVSELVEHYHRKQTEDRRPKSLPKVGKQDKQDNSVKEMPNKLFSLNFAKYRRAGRFSYKMMPPGKVQVPGFCNADKHLDVITKGARGLGIDATPDQLSLIVSNGLIRDVPLPSGQPWTLGNYIDQFGGVQARGKRTFGIFVQLDDEEEESKSGDEQDSIQDRRRSHPTTSNCAIAPKRLKWSQPASTLGTIPEDPINLDSDSDESLEFGSEESTTFGLYSPVSAGKIFPSITANGREGVWRLLRMEYCTPQEKVLKEMEDDMSNLQPECEGFILVELHSGGTTYLKAKTDSKTEVQIQDLSFFVKEKKIVHSKTKLKLGKSPAALIVISPNHGRVEYKWEWKRIYVEDWKVVDVPSWTCLLYVDVTGQYRCTVEDSTILFHVQAPSRCKGKKATIKDELSTEYQEIQFGKLVGRGSYGTVYKGVWRGQTVALKRLQIPPGMDKSQVLANSQEVAALRLLKHPNIVSLLGLAASAEEIVLIMNFVSGNNLDVLIFGKEKILSKATDEQRINIAKSIARGVEFMHSRDPAIIHQDIKPLNIMVSDDMQGVFICDMGISKLRYASQTSITTVSKGPTGTFPYMAPEMFGTAHRGTAVDIYALGCLYIELFGQRRVWPGLDGIQIMQKVCGSFTIPPIMPDTSHLYSRYGKICLACCQLDYKMRPKIATVLKLLENN